jgi:hypothetical protein
VYITSLQEAAAPISKKGFLYKTGSDRAGWKRRYCTLDKFRGFQYYKTETVSTACTTQLLPLYIERERERERDAYAHTKLGSIHYNFGQPLAMSSICTSATSMYTGPCRRLPGISLSSIYIFNFHMF